MDILIETQTRRFTDDRSNHFCITMPASAELSSVKEILLPLILDIAARRAAHKPSAEFDFTTTTSQAPRKILIRPRTERKLIPPDHFSSPGAVRFDALSPRQRGDGALEGFFAEWT